MRNPGGPVLLPILYLAACYSPSEEPGTDTDAMPATTSGMDDGGDGSTSTLGMTSTPDDGVDDDPTGVDPSTSSTTVSVDESSGDDATTVAGSESSDSGPEPAVCGNGTLEGDEECDDGNPADGDFCAADCTIETRVFAFTGGEQMFTMPAWATAITVEAYGAQGGHAMCCLDDGTNAVDDDGGRGGYATGTLAVDPGTVVRVYVGGQGVTEGAGGWNGGGSGGEWGAGGGGASDVRVGGQGLPNRVLVAGGGGGGNCGCPDHGAGGPGGGLSGGAGISLQGLLAPGGGTQTVGGAAGEQPGVAGGPGIGGSYSSDAYHIAGGGGGWFGGGSAYAAGGAGGSSYLGSASDASTQADSRDGNGEVRITPVVR